MSVLPNCESQHARVVSALVLKGGLWACGHAPVPMPSAAFAHPIFLQPYSCMEHWAGNLQGLGDALGTDCVIQELVESNGRTWRQAYRGDGSKNEYWLGWHKDVLSPCSCVVVSVKENEATNLPGIPGKPPASEIELRTPDGTYFGLAHMVDVRVGVGDAILAGKVLARVGNNG